MKTHKAEEFIFTSPLNKVLWDDVKVYKDDFKDVIKQREKNRIAFHHRSPQFQCREYLVEYMKRSAISLKLAHCTLHLAVYILDIFMDNHSIHQEKLYLIANVSLLLAGKIEENNLKAPKIKVLNRLLESEYSVIEYHRTELVFLKFFNWYVTFPTAAHYVHYYLQAVLCDEDYVKSGKSGNALIYEIDFVIRFYLDKILDDIHYMQKYKPSLLACAIIAIARSEIGLDAWTKQLKVFSNYAETDIEDTKYGLTMNLPLECKNCIGK